HLNDVDVMKQRRGRGFALEQLDHTVVLEEVRQDPLDRDRAAEPRGSLDLRPPDLGHAAAPEALEQPIFAALQCAPRSRHGTCEPLQGLRGCDKPTPRPMASALAATTPTTTPTMTLVRL